MSYSEEEAERYWPAAAVHHESGAVIDGSDVIGIECVTDTEYVGDDTNSNVCSAGG